MYGLHWKNYDGTKTNRNLKFRTGSVFGGYNNTSVDNVPFPRDYFELINQVSFYCALWIFCKAKVLSDDVFVVENYRPKKQLNWL